MQHVDLTNSDYIAIILCFVSTLIGALIAWGVTKIAINRTRKDIETAVDLAVSKLQETIPKDAAGQVTKDNLLNAILVATPWIVKAAAHLSDNKPDVKDAKGQGAGPHS